LASSGSVGQDTNQLYIVVLRDANFDPSPWLCTSRFGLGSAPQSTDMGHVGVIATTFRVPTQVFFFKSNAILMDPNLIIGPSMCR